jgi:GNAT superfamily N-acetyltransferase
LVDEPVGPASSDVRSLTLSDVPAVGRLMYDAYLGTVDYAGETVADAIEETRRTFEGAHGPFLSDASPGLFVDGDIQSAVIVTLFENEPLLAFCITRPAYQRRGYCRRLVLDSLRALHRAGYKSANLYVTKANAPALDLYRQLHFDDAIA